MDKTESRQARTLVPGWGATKGFKQGTNTARMDGKKVTQAASSGQKPGPGRRFGGGHRRPGRNISIRWELVGAGPREESL